jgi:DNA-binding MarR family transcriptional regulator
MNDDPLHPIDQPLHMQQYRLIHDIYVTLDYVDREALTPFDLTPSQYTLLLLLDRDDGRRLIDLADRLLVARSTITRLIDQLEEKQLVSRVNDPDDRRAQRVMLTEIGLERREAAREVHESSVAARLQQIHPDDQESLAALLKTMLRSVLHHVGFEPPPYAE